MDQKTMRRPAAAAELRRLGVMVTAQSLAVLHCYGGGPVYTKPRMWAEYRQSDLETYAKQRIAAKARGQQFTEASIAA